MKHFSISIYILLLVFFVTPTAHAQSSVDMDSLLEKINLLLARVTELQTALALTTQINTQTKIYQYTPSDIYSGEYEKIYHVNDRVLTPTDTGAIRSDDQLFWNTFADIVGANFVHTYINEFRVFNDSESDLGAFIEPKADGSWVVGFNKNDVSFAENLKYGDTYELIVHEFAHVYFDEQRAIETKFTNTFWNTSSLESYLGTLQTTSQPAERIKIAETYFETHQNDFVSSYAALSPLEDLIETFTTFVFEDTRYRSATRANEKIFFFYQYPEIQLLRNELRLTLPAHSLL